MTRSKPWLYWGKLLQNKGLYIVLKFLSCFEILKLVRLTNWGQFLMRLSCYWSWISLLTYRNTRNCRQFVFYKNKLSTCPLSLVVSLSHLSVRLLRMKISQWSRTRISLVIVIFLCFFLSVHDFNTEQKKRTKIKLFQNILHQKQELHRRTGIQNIFFNR